MQTTPVPILSSNPLAVASTAAPAAPAAAPAPRRANAAPNADARQFSQSLSREMEQRNHGVTPAAKPAAAPKPATSTPAKADDAGKADKAEDNDDARDARDAAAIGPVTDMLALVASFGQPGGPTPAPATDALVAGAVAQPAALPGAAGKGLGVDVDADPLSAAGTLMAAAGDGKQAASGKGKPPIDGALKTADDLAASDAKSNDAALPSTFANALKARADAAPAHAREALPDAAAKAPALTVGAEASAPLVAPVQQASLAMAQAIAGTPTDKIAARVGTPGWDNQVGQKIVWMVAGKEQTASLTLNPPDMGPMQVVLSVTGDQASVTFTAAQPEVRQALEAALPKLREMMGENGIALGNASVNAGTQDGRQAQQGEQPRGQATGTSSGNSGPDAAPISLAPPRPGWVSGGNGMVDTFA